MIKRLTIIVVALFTCFSAAGGANAHNYEGIQVYQKNLHLNPEHKQQLVEDIRRYQSADDLWDALREEFTLSHYENHPAVQEKINWYMNNQGFLIRSVERAAPYLYYIMQQVRKRHLPAELVLLPIMESGYNPFSMSPVGAAGIWQLMPATAADLGVRQDWWYDGRRDVITSTGAALNHLDYLQRIYEGNWLLALAAYDTGEGNLRNAILKNIRNGRNTDFWSLPLANETRSYVPSLLALATIISHPELYPVPFPPIRNAPYLAQIDVGSQIDLKLAATFAGLSYKRLMQLNPGYSRPLTPNKGPFKLVLPIERVEQFTENLVRSPMNTRIKWVHYRVRVGETLASIAKKHHVNPEAIRRLNQLTGNSLRRHAHILVPMGQLNSAINYVAEPVIKQAFKPIRPAKVTTMSSSKTEYKIQPGDTVYMVRNGDSQQAIANRFHISTEVLCAANRISRTAHLQPGKQLVIPTHSTSNSSIQPGDTVYMVRRGDTIDIIADKFHTSPAAIRLANLLDNNSLQEGDRILVPTHFNG